LRLAIVSQSARIYAEMARREGFEVLAVDAFADVDTAEAAHEVLRLPALIGQLKTEDISKLTDKLDAWQPEHILTGSGLEANIECYEHLYRRYALSGNTSGVIAQVKNPFWLNTYCEAHKVMTPAVRSQAPVNGRWLYKVAGQSGGRHVRDWAGSDSAAGEGYWQAFQAGLAVGALFVANRQTVTLIGVHALKQSPGTYTYAGAARLHGPRLVEAMQDMLQTLVPELGLTGVNSVDAIWQDGRLHLLEINPRLSASMRLYTKLPLIQAHITSGQGVATPELNPDTMHGSHCILYAKQAIEASELDFPAWLEDRPDGGSIPAGQPVCSLYAEGRSEDEMQQALQDRKTQLEKLWGTYVCERIEFNIH
jgi:predicted ATP-grasp superfamily ATP-dependent carboligase